LPEVKDERATAAQPLTELPAFGYLELRLCEVVLQLPREAGLALRRLASAPGFAAAAMLSLSLAIGANSAIFSAVHAVVLRPLPIREPDRLVTCWETDAERNLAILEVSYRNFRDWQAENRSFTGLAAMGSSNWTKVLEGRGDPVRLAFAAVTASFFDVLGATPALGRAFLPTEDVPGAGSVVVLSHAAWRRRFGADPTIIGRAITLDSRPYTVVGVMPRDFEYPRGAEFWTPLVPILAESSAEWKLDALEARGLGLLYVVGRLKPGVTPALAARDLDRIVRSLATGDAPKRLPKDPVVVVTPFLDQLLGPVRHVVLWLFAAVALVLLIGCANVSGLMLTRATERRREDAIRRALGADGGRLVLPWLVEAGWLALFGALAGLLGARWLTSVIVALAPPELSGIAGIGVDGGVVAFTLAAGALAAVACALAPAWRSASSDVATALADAARSTPGASPLRMRSALVVVEIALAVVVLIAAGLIVRSFAKLRQLDLGYDPANVLALDVEPQGEAADHRREYYRELLTRVQALPDVEAAGAVYLRPLALGPIGQEMGVMLEGQEETAARNPLVDYESVTPGYFRAMRIPLMRGRLFDERDGAGAPKVAIIGESTARRLWPGRDPIGRRLATQVATPEGLQNAWHTVVGVVKDARYRGLGDVRLDFYEPSDQAFPAYVAGQVLVRTSGDPLAVAGAVHAAARALDRHVVVSGVTTMEAVIGRAMAPWRFATWMFMLFAMLAFVLAAGGLFSLVTLNVALRSREFAVRMALGAHARDITRRVLLDAGRHALLGVSLGVLAATLGTRWLASLLFEVRPLDLGTYAAVIAAVLTATAGASLVPALRASRLDPMTVLREG
jgi:putative ABC transport system permease protein